MDGEEVFFFYCLMVFSENIYYMEELNSIVIYTEGEKEKNIHYAASENKDNITKIIAGLSNGNKKINVDFNIDDSGIAFEYQEFDNDDDALFVLGEIEGKVKFVHPVTIHA